MLSRASKLLTLLWCYLNLKLRAMQSFETEFTNWFKSLTDEQKKKNIIKYGNHLMAFEYFKHYEKLADYETNSSCPGMRDKPMF
tara:strand:- start:3355 stop:3606 length:252 start_codon:yes stop_codon:yes gene_type:complete